MKNYLIYWPVVLAAAKAQTEHRHDHESVQTEHRIDHEAGHENEQSASVSENKPSEISRHAVATSLDTASTEYHNLIDLEAAQVSARKQGLVLSSYSTVKLETINQEELCKAACCNPRKVSKPILGGCQLQRRCHRLRRINSWVFRGCSVQLLSEGLPFLRGLAAPYG